MDDKQLKVEMLADRLSSILPLIDGFAESLSEEDNELLIEAMETLKNKINRNNSALPIIFACGGNYDDAEDTMKLKTLDCLINLIKIRKEYKEIMLQSQKEKDNMQQVLKLFDL